MPTALSLKVNGTEIRMNDFVRRALGCTLDGFIRALEDVPAKIDRIEVVIGPAEEKR